MDLQYQHRDTQTKLQTNKYGIKAEGWKKTVDQLKFFYSTEMPSLHDLLKKNAKKKRQLQQGQRATRILDCACQRIKNGNDQNQHYDQGWKKQIKKLQKSLSQSIQQKQRLQRSLQKQSKLIESLKRQTIKNSSKRSLHQRESYKLQSLQQQFSRQRYQRTLSKAELRRKNSMSMKKMQMNFKQFNEKIFTRSPIRRKQSFETCPSLANEKLQKNSKKPNKIGKSNEIKKNEFKQQKKQEIQRHIKQLEKLMQILLQNSYNEQNRGKKLQIRNRMAKIVGQLNFLKSEQSEIEDQKNYIYENIN